MSAHSILVLITAIIIANYLIGLVLELLNIRHSKIPLPSEAKGIYDQESYEKSQRYQMEKTRFSFITSGISILITLSFLLLGGFGWLDELVSPITDNSVFRALIYFAVLFLANDLLNLPFQLYSLFVIEEKYGFNKTTSGTFVKDKLKGYILAAILGTLIVGGLLLLIEQLGSSFWIYFWIAISLFMVVMNMFYTTLILPLFNKLTQLEDGALRSSIEAFSEKVDFPLTNIFVIDGSRRSSKANAFFSGLGKKKKVVLYDTLIEKHEVSELVAIFAHEVGHYKKRHIILSMVLSILQTGVMLFLLSLMVFNQNLTAALGGHGVLIHLNLIAFGILYSPISMITGLLMSIVSRKNEYEADRYAAEYFDGDKLSTALKKLAKDNLSNLTPHPAFVFVHYSHPTLLQRLDALARVPT